MFLIKPENMETEKNRKEILYIDMGNVLVDLESGYNLLSEEEKELYEEKLFDVPGVFTKMLPMPYAIESVNILAQYYDVYILSTAPWNNPSAWADKLLWVKKYLGEVCHKRLILTHHKNLNKGKYLIDDREKNGAKEFEGELILFGSDKFPDWKSVVAYLMKS